MKINDVTFRTKTFSEYGTEFEQCDVFIVCCTNYGQSNSIYL